MISPNLTKLKMENDMTEITDLMLKEKDPGKLDVSKISAWVFDLDNTIYPANQSLFLSLIHI